MILLHRAAKTTGRCYMQEFLRDVLEKEKVDTKGLLLDEQYFTTLAFVNVNKEGERTFSFARKPGADTKIRKEEIDVDVLDNTCIFHIGSLSLTDEPARDSTFYAVKRAKNKGSIISYDPNYRASLWEDEETEPMCTAKRADVWFRALL